MYRCGIPDFEIAGTSAGSVKGDGSVTLQSWGAGGLFLSLRGMSPRGRESDHAFGVGATRQSTHVRQTDAFNEVATPRRRRGVQRRFSASSRPY